MRVIAGSARGTKLVACEGRSVRPTLDRVKESVFSMLTGRIADARALDLFAGSGALGIEALSRGARSCVFVDKSRQHLDVAQQNIQKTRLAERASLVCADFAQYLRSAEGPFELVFLDPPYGGTFVGDALAHIRERGLLAPDGLVVCELDGPDEIDVGEMQIVRDRQYGRVRILILTQVG